MAIQLTSEQEHQLQAVVRVGAYPSVDEALNAALIMLQGAAASSFDGNEREFETLLTEGLESKELTEEEFWHSIDEETNAMLAAHKPRQG